VTARLGAKECERELVAVVLLPEMREGTKGDTDRGRSWGKREYAS